MLTVMITAQAQSAADQVLHAFSHDAAYLFLGSAFVTVGIVSVAYCFLRRRFEPLLVWLAAFAALYGIRMWLQSTLMGFELARNLVLSRISVAVNFLIPIPGFTFLQIAGFVGHSKKEKPWRFIVVFLGLVVASLIFGPRALFYTINNIVVTIFLWILFFRSLGRRTHNKEVAAVRIGVLTFVALALFDNTLGAVRGLYRLEPYGFAIMLGTFGYMAARRTLDREVELGEMQKELSLARNIQQSILPASFPKSANFSVAAGYRPMTSVAGDLYDFLLASDREAGLLIADVSGHGVPAAMIASMVKMAADSRKTQANQPAALLREMNAALYGSTHGEMITAAYLYLESEGHEICYAAAGHPAMLLLRKGGVSEIVENGLPLAAAALDSYQEIRLALKTGDRFLLYTDGLVEARNGAGEMFGEERLNQSLAATAAISAEAAVEQIMAAVERWTAEQDDDRTVLVCDYLGAQEA
ncbi:MAG: PP2C family protein-serine/threonine phosphatase [Terracidiphilus sp.]